MANGLSPSRSFTITIAIVLEYNRQVFNLAVQALFLITINQSLSKCALQYSFNRSVDRILQMIRKCSSFYSSALMSFHFRGQSRPRIFSNMKI